MLKTVWTVAAIGLLVLGAANCGDADNSSPSANANEVVPHDYATDVCQKLDECNALEAGESAADCADYWQRALNEMTASKRADCEAQLADCLGKRSCENFLDCSIDDCD